jgi:hypothetical protein
MNGGVALRLFAATVCSLLGAHLWRGDARGETTEGRARDGELATVRRDAGVAGSDAKSRVSRDPATSREGEKGPEDPKSPGATRPSEGSDSSATHSNVPTSARPQPRADLSAVAALPPVVGPVAPHIPEALARVALRFVGKDPSADALWREAIDDVGLSKEARSDLIEDLNDEGYPDPDHLTAADLPLILERIRIIERLAPHALDDVNAAAFEEAYKDLVDMLVGLRRGASGRR